MLLWPKMGHHLEYRSERQETMSLWYFLKWRNFNVFINSHPLYTWLHLFTWVSSAQKYLRYNRISSTWLVWTVAECDASSAVWDNKDHISSSKQQWHGNYEPCSLRRKWYTARYKQGTNWDKVSKLCNYSRPCKIRVTVQNYLCRRQI